MKFKTQTFRLTQKQIHELEGIIDTSNKVGLVTEFNFDENTVTLADTTLNTVLELVCSAENNELLDAFTKQDAHDVIKQFETFAIQEPII